MSHPIQDDSKSMLGFWIYLMTDCLLFGSLFATYAVLRNNVYGGPSGAVLFDIPFVLVETLILLTSSFTMGLALLAARNAQRWLAFTWLAVTFVLGVAFLGLELGEFTKLVNEGHGWQESGFLTAFFTLVGTHGLHILVGLIWALVLIAQLLKRGLRPTTVKRLGIFSLYWHFLDVVWIFIFTVVYLFGVTL